MQRIITVIYAIASVLAWQIYAPYFHAHEVADGGMIHSHFDIDPTHEHHDDDHAELQLPHRGHHAADVSVFSGHFSPPVGTLAEVREVYRLVESPILRGSSIEQPVRVHDPPARGLSNPRSPPA
jgi:hypothetical protein